jgi:hypothetical protein
VVERVKADRAEVEERVEALAAALRGGLAEVRADVEVAVLRGGLCSSSVRTFPPLRQPSI